MNKKIVLLLILILGFLLRFWQLGNNPPALDWDEASLGYNAYSILKTGRDEYGTLLPLSIRSFGDYKPPVYSYLSIIPISFLGLTEFSVRVISAIFGLLTVLVTYDLIREILSDKSPKLYLLTAFFLAVSPWHIQFSRIAFEANVAVFFFVTGVWLYLKGFYKGKYFILSFLSFVIAAYTYHSPRLVIPLFILGSLLIFREKIWNGKKWFLAAALLAAILTLPIVQQFKSNSSRLGSVTILNPSEQLGQSIDNLQFDKQRHDFMGELMHNRRVIFAKEILAGYLDHFNFDFLFLTGDPPGRHHASDMGMLYLWDLPFILIGILFLLKNRSNQTAILFWWFIIAPVASAITTGTPHAVRALLYLPAYQIFAAVGTITAVIFIRQRFKGLNTWIISFIFILFLVNFFYYLNTYWVHTPLEDSQWWQYGYKEVVQTVMPIEKSYNKVIVTYRYDQPYIFFLFYGQVNPSWYQQNWGGSEIKRSERNFGKFEFRNIDWGKDSQLKNVVLIGTPNEIPPGSGRLIKEIHFLDGTVAFRIIAL